MITYRTNPKKAYNRIAQEEEKMNKCGSTDVVWEKYI